MNLFGAQLQTWALLSCMLLGGASNVQAQSEVAPAVFTASGPQLTAEGVEQLRREAAETPGLDEAKRKAVDAAYQAGLTQIQAAAGFTERAAALEKEAAAVDARLSETRRQIDVAANQDDQVETSAELAKLEQELAQQELTLTNLRKKYASLEGEPQARAQRRKEIRARLATLTEVLTARTGETTGAHIEDAALLAAKEVEESARTVAMEQELLALKAELAKYDAEDAVDLVRLQTDLAAKLLAKAEHVVETLAAAVKQKREVAAKESVRQARLESIRATPMLKSYADRNHTLAETAQSTAESLTKAENELAKSQEVFAAFQKQIRLTHKKIDTVGLTSSIGALLRKQRATLPDSSARQAAIAARRALIDATQYDLFDYADEREELSDLEAMIEEVALNVGPHSELTDEHLKAAVRELLERKRDYLDSLMKTSNQYFDALVELDTSDRQIVALTKDYADFIDERVLWIRSGQPLGKQFSLDDSDAKLVSATAWVEFARYLYQDVKRAPVGHVAGLAAFIFAVVGSTRLRRRIASLGATAEKANCRSLAPTWNALEVTVALASIWPLGCAAVGWRLHGLGNELARAAGSGLLCTGLLWAPIELFRQICRPKGMGESHFGWSSSVMHLLRHRLRWFLLMSLPLAFVTTMLLSLDTLHDSDAVERVTFIGGALITAIFAGRMLRPSGLLRDYIALHKNSWVARLGWLWPLVGAATPAVLGALAFVGYYYTAQELAWRALATCCFLAAVVLLRALLLRALMLRRRSLSIEQAKARAAEAAAVTAEATPESVVAGIVTSTPQADLNTQSEQTRRLVTAGLFATSAVGLWLIWVQVLPALAMLDQYPLWNNSSVATAAAPTAPLPVGPIDPTAPPAESPAETVNTTGQASVTTLSDLGLSLLIAFVTFVLARNGPGLLEMSVLQQLPLDASIRYAISTLVSYTIVFVGIVMSCSMLGLQWSQIQWLATALTFGLAFGLQEMFANFVAGLIILLERPIRVGDIVTVDEVTGVVSRIRIRATSITNWDRKEYVVPNKEFITGRLLNWTLSDKVNRIVINVGVAYGTDTERARELLLAAANEHPLVLDDPPSVATFEGFGDNSLNLVLRTYLPSLDNRLDVIHQLHTAIDKAFRAEGIEIAFPQRDLYIRSAPAALSMALDSTTEKGSGKVAA